MSKIKKLYLIDDSRSVNSRNENLLSKIDLFGNIEKFSEPKSALESLKKLNVADLPELIFLDLNMPEMDGFEFLNNYVQIKPIEESDYKPIVVIVSDHLGFENFEKSKYFKSYGVMEHIKKPMDSDDIRDLLDEHFDKFS